MRRKIRQSNLARVIALAIGITVLALPWITSSLTATILIPQSLVQLSADEVTPDSLKPANCIGPKALTSLHVGSGTVTGTVWPDLVLGGPGDDNLNGLDDDDCLVGGGGNNVLDGGSGNDVCVGPPETQFINCEVEDTSGY